jgi:polyhydroxyalkanoate synthase
MNKQLSLIFCVACMILSGCAWRYVYRPPDNQNEIHYCKTVDDWDIALYRYKPTAQNPAACPVILCHGLGNNNYLWDNDRGHSFAAYLRDRGHDVWVIAFRGAGKSMKPGIIGLSKLIEIRSVKEERITYHPHKLNWNIEDYIEKDLPAAIAYVKAETGKEKVNCIGHSLGSVVICGYLERFGPRHVNAVVTMAMAVIFPKPLNAVLQRVERHDKIISASLLLNSRAAALFEVPVGGKIETDTDALLFNMENMDRELLARYLSNGVEDISMGVAHQYINILKAGENISADGRYNYTRNLNLITVPMLVVAGKVDNTAPPYNAIYAWAHTGSADKTLKIFGKQDGNIIDYGHTDLIIGKYAPREVYPYVCNWLDRHPVEPAQAARNNAP